MFKLILILLALGVVAAGITVAPGVKRPWVPGVIAIVVGLVAALLTVFVAPGPIASP